MDEWTQIIFRNGVKLDLEQSVSDVIGQMAAASKSGSLSLVLLTLRGGGSALVSAPEVVAVAARALSADGNVSMLQSTRWVLDEADRVTEMKKDDDGKMIGAISRVVRA